MIKIKHCVYLIIFTWYASSLMSTPLTNASIMFFPDNKEYNFGKTDVEAFGGSSAAFMQAMGQNAAPIIVSTALLKRILDHKKDIIKETQFSEQNFDLWIYKKIHNSLYLLIPKTYNNVPELKTYTIRKKALTTPTLTALELKLGLKIDHFETIPTGVVNVINVQKEDFDAYLIKRLPDIFVLNSDYTKAGVPLEQKPRWAIYLLGHGSRQIIKNQFEVSSLSFNNFKNFLNFIESKISTGFFFFQTCFGGGKNLESIYESLNKSAVQRTFAFTIASGALSDAPSATLSYTMEGKVVVELDYKTFFEQLRQEGPLDFPRILNNVTFFLTARGLDFAQNIPILKLPGLEWSSVIDIPNRIVSIGQTLAKSRDPKNTLDVSTFFAGRSEIPGQKSAPIIYPEALLLYASHIPFPLKLTAKPTGVPIPPAFISMIPSEAVHEFSKIEAPQFGFTQLAEAFFKLPWLYTEKIFFIKELSVLESGSDRLLDLTNVIFFNNVYIPSLSTAANGMYYTLNGSYYWNHWPPKQEGEEKLDLKNALPLTDNYIDEWLGTMGIYKTSYQKEPTIFKESIEDLKKTLAEQVHGKKTPKHMQGSVLSFDLSKLSTHLQSLATILL